MNVFRLLPVSLVFMVVFAVACGSSDDEIEEPAAQVAGTTMCPTSSENAIPFEDALVFIEFNSTDEDLGFMPRSTSRVGKKPRSAALTGLSSSRSMPTGARRSTVCPNFSLRELSRRSTSSRATSSLHGSLRENIPLLA